MNGNKDSVNLASVQYIKRISQLDAVEETSDCVRRRCTATGCGDSESEMGSSVDKKNCTVAEERLEVVSFRIFLTTVHVA